MRTFERLNQLLQAAYDGNLEEVQRHFIKNLPMPDQTDDGYTALHYAAANGHLKVVEWLLENGLKADEMANTGETALSLATNFRHFEVLKLLQRSAEPDSADLPQSEITPLVAPNKLPEAPALPRPFIPDLQENPNAPDSDLAVEFTNAIFNGQFNEAKFLFEKLENESFDFNPDKFKHFWEVPFCSAIKKQNSNLVQFLLMKIKELEKQINNPIKWSYSDNEPFPELKSKSPMSWACQKGDFKTVQLLLEHCLNKDGRNYHLFGMDFPMYQHSQTEYPVPLFTAISKKQFEIAELILKTLLKKQPDSRPVLHFKDPAYEILYGGEINLPYIKIAAKYGANRLVQLLLDNGAHINTMRGPLAHTNDGHTPLEIAVFSRNFETVKLLLNYSEKPLEDQASNDRPPFHDLNPPMEIKAKAVFIWAIQSGNVELCQYLISTVGYELLVDNEASKTPLQWALAFKQWSVASMLLEMKRETDRKKALADALITDNQKVFDGVFMFEPKIFFTNSKQFNTKLFTSYSADTFPLAYPERCRLKKGVLFARAEMAKAYISWKKNKLEESAEHIKKALEFSFDLVECDSSRLEEGGYKDLVKRSIAEHKKAQTIAALKRDHKAADSGEQSKKLPEGVSALTKTKKSKENGPTKRDAEEAPLPSEDISSPKKRATAAPMVATSTKTSKPEVAGLASNQNIRPEKNGAAVEESVQAPVSKSNLIAADSGEQFEMFPVLGDGDCGFTAFGITRSFAYQLISKNLFDVRDILTPLIQEALCTDENFIKYLSQDFPAVNQAYYSFIAALQRKDSTLEDFEKRLKMHANDLNLLSCYLDYDVKDKKVDAGWAHPLILVALAHIQCINLRLWVLNQEGKLIPHHEYLGYQPKGEITEHTDLLFVRGNHFERLQKVAPTPLDQHSPIQKNLPQSNNSNPEFFNKTQSNSPKGVQNSEDGNSAKRAREEAALSEQNPTPEKKAAVVEKASTVNPRLFVTSTDKPKEKAKEHQIRKKKGQNDNDEPWDEYMKRRPRKKYGKIFVEPYQPREDDELLKRFLESTGRKPK